MIRQKIKSELKAQKLSQAKIANELNLNKGNFCSWLKGHREMPLRDIERIFQYLKIDF